MHVEQVPEYELVLRAIEELAAEQNLPIIGPKRGRLLTDLIKQHRPQRIVEIGALVGYSSILMAASLEQGATVISIEVEPARAAISGENQRRAGLAGRCQVLQGDALELIPRLERPWDMLFIDAVKEDYLRYLRAAEPALAPRAIVVADNVKRFAREVDGYLDYVRNSSRYDSVYHDFGDDGVEVSVVRPTTWTFS